MSNHQRFAETATKLIAKHGRTIQLISIVDSGAEWSPSQTKTLTPINAVNISFDKSETQGGLVQSGDMKYLTDSSVEISTDMKIQDGREMSIISFVKVEPGDQAILYKVHCRA